MTMVRQGNTVFKWKEGQTLETLSLVQLLLRERHLRMRSALVNNTFLLIKLKSS